VERKLTLCSVSRQLFLKDFDEISLRGGNWLTMQILVDPVQFPDPRFLNPDPDIL